MTLSMISYAHDFVAYSRQECEKGSRIKSWGWTLSARAAFACESIVQAVVLPFQILKVLFHTLKYILEPSYRNGERATYKLFDAEYMVNKLFISTIGALISPELGVYLDTHLMLRLEKTDANEVANDPAF